MSIKAKIEAIIYAAEEPVPLEQIVSLVKEDVRQELARQRTAEAEPAEPSDSEPDATIPVQDDAAPIPADADAGAETLQPEESAPEAPSESETASDPETAEVATEVEAEATAEVAAEAGPEAVAEPEPITDGEVKSAVRAMLEELTADYAREDHGIEVRQIAGGYRMATKPEQHDLVRGFAKSLKPPVRLSLQALETLAVIAYKQPITAPEIGDIRGVDTGGVVGTLLDRKLITTAGRKQVIGRPILYKTTKEFLLRFGLKDLGELPSVEEFERLAAESLGGDLFAAAPDYAAATTEPAASTAEPAAAAAETTDAGESAESAAPESESSPAEGTEAQTENAQTEAAPADEPSNKQE